MVFKLDRLRPVRSSPNGFASAKDGIHIYSLSEDINTTTPGGERAFFSAVAASVIVDNTALAPRLQENAVGRSDGPYGLMPDAIVGAHSTIMRDGAPKGFQPETARARMVCTIVVDVNDVGTDSIAKNASPGAATATGKCLEFYKRDPCLRVGL